MRTLTRVPAVSAVKGVDCKKEKGLTSINVRSSKTPLLKFRNPVNVVEILTLTSTMDINREF